MAGFQEYQAVIMAVDEGSRNVLYPLADKRLAAALPVGNQPLLLFQVDLFYNAGIRDLIVVVTQSDSKVVQRALNGIEYWKGLECVVEVVPDDVGAADALRICRRLITRPELIVIDADLVTNVDLVRIADFHRTTDALLTLVLHNMPDFTDDEKSSTKKMIKAATADLDRSFIGLDGIDQRLIFIRSAALIECKDTFFMKKSLLSRHPHVTLHSRLKNSRLVFMSAKVLDLLERKPSISSLHGELIPYLVDKQFDGSLRIDENDMQHLYMDRESRCIGEFGSFKCSVYIAPEDCLCERIITLRTFKEINARVAKQATTREGKDWQFVSAADRSKETALANEGTKVFGSSLILNDVTLGKGTILRNSLVGPRCRVGEKVELKDAILMDGVTIEDGTVIERTTVGHDCYIEHSCQIIDCTVSPEIRITAQDHRKNEIIAD